MLHLIIVMVISEKYKGRSCLKIWRKTAWCLVFIQPAGECTEALVSYFKKVLKITNLSSNISPIRIKTIGQQMQIATLKKAILIKFLKYIRMFKIMFLRRTRIQHIGLWSQRLCWESLALFLSMMLILRNHSKIYSKESVGLLLLMKNPFNVLVLFINKIGSSASVVSNLKKSIWCKNPKNAFR